MAKQNDEAVPSAQLAALEAFVAENDELLELEERIGRFNIFDALGVARAEIRHSNFLAWLLDPSETHGQGDLFLKAVLMDMFKQSPPERRPLSAAHLDGADLHDAEVHREWNHLDLVIVCRSQKIVVAIENKVDSGEHSGQLSRYEKTVRDEYADLRQMFVFLTPEGDDASDDDWVPYSYGDLHRVLSRVRKTTVGSLGVDVEAFLDHYLSLVRSRMMNDPEIDELCRRIYKNHKAAIDLIVERAGVGTSAVIARLTASIASSPEKWVITKSGQHEVRFMPRSWLKVLPPIRRSFAKDEAVRRCWVACYLWNKDGQLQFSVWVLKTADPILQERVLQRLIRTPEEFGFAYPKRKTRFTKEWTPLLEEMIAEWDAEGDHDEDSIVARGIDRIEKFHSMSDALATAMTEALADATANAAGR